jgi:hypothetical protein
MKASPFVKALMEPITPKGSDANGALLHGSEGQNTSTLSKYLKETMEFRLICLLEMRYD